jgi:LmbE family N-acetylglucosaminyl deacetylase
MLSVSRTQARAPASDELNGRTLVLAHARRAAALRSRLPDALILDEHASLEAMDGQFDAAYIESVLENERWDRWKLQRVHRALRMDAPIVLVVPRLLSIASIVDLPFLTYAARKLLERLVQRRMPGFRLPGPVHRRYHIPRLIRTLEALGYTAVEARSRWNGSARLSARKASSLAGFSGRPYPDMQVHRKRHAEQTALLFAAREAWLARFPQFRGTPPRALEPARWRGERVLVLSPHPDDELIGCGGTLCQLVSAGAEVSILQATDGGELRSVDDLPAARRKGVRAEEASRVAAGLGAKPVLWQYEDSRLRCDGETVARLAGLLGELRPALVFTPFLGDAHPDHITLSLILAGALGAIDVEPEVLQYEVWSVVPANRYCDVTRQMRTLEELLLLYERAMRADDFVHFCESRNLARGFELTGRPAYVEAYLSTDSTEFQRLAHA